MGLFFVDFYLQQIEVHEAGVERQTAYTDTHVFGFQSLVSDKVMEAVLFVIMECLRTVEGIDDEKTATRTVIVLCRSLESLKPPLPRGNSLAYPDSAPCVRPRSRMTLPFHHRV